MVIRNSNIQKEEWERKERSCGGRGLERSGGKNGSEDPAVREGKKNGSEDPQLQLVKISSLRPDYGLAGRL